VVVAIDVVVVGHGATVEVVAPGSVVGGTVVVLDKPGAQRRADPIASLMI
jgi:hypothetical protein